MAGVVFFGSGGFGLPALEGLRRAHDVRLAVTQPDRAAGRGRRLTATPVARLAEEAGLDVLKTADVNDPDASAAVRSAGADVFIVIAFGQKLGPALLGDTFAVNLHASLLPRYRGAAPVAWAIINGESETGVTVIAISQRIDAGDILVQRSTPLDPMETAGELEARLAALGPEAVMETLDRHEKGTLRPVAQQERLACRAPRLTKADGTVRFDQAAAAVQRRVHGLTPWPGCTVSLDGERLRLLRAAAADDAGDARPGELLGDDRVACAPGILRLLEVQPPGGRPMPFADYRRGRGLPASATLEPLCA